MSPGEEYAARKLDDLARADAERRAEREAEEKETHLRQARRARIREEREAAMMRKGGYQDRALFDREGRGDPG